MRFQGAVLRALREGDYHAQNVVETANERGLGERLDALRAQEVAGA